MYREAKLYYGDGSCYVEGQDITGVQITYKGSISVQDKTNDEYGLSANNSTILIIPISKINNTLSNLFEYNGGKNLISWISNKDFFNQINYFDMHKGPISKLEDTYDFITSEYYPILEKELEKQNLAIVFTRGEKRRIGLTKITTYAKEQAKECTGKKIENDTSNLC